MDLCVRQLTWQSVNTRRMWRTPLVLAVVHLAQVTTCSLGDRPRLHGDAVLELLQGDRDTRGRPDGRRRRAVLSRRPRRLRSALAGEAVVPEPLDRDPDSGQRLIGAVRRDLADHDGLSMPTAVRIIWTGDHLDAVRSLHQSLVGPARTVARVRS